MAKRKLILLLVIFTSISVESFGQIEQIGTPKLDFDGQKLTIQYDMNNASSSDQYYVWVLIQKKNGESVKMSSLSGDYGDVKGGSNKVITWVPASDSVFLNEEVTVEIQAEKYIKSFNKGSVMLKSILLPGLGQTKVSGG